MFAFSLYLYSRVSNKTFDIVSPIAWATIVAIGLSLYSYLSPTLNESLARGEFFFSANRRYQGYLVLFAAISLTLKVLTQRTSARDVLFCTITFGYMIWLGGRGTLVAYFSTLFLAMGLLIWHNQLQTKNLAKLVVLILSSTLCSIPLNVFSWNGLNRFVRTDETVDFMTSSAFQARISLWYEAWNNFKVQPLFGYGAEGHHFNTEIGFLQPHNFVLQWLVEFGAIGTLLLASLVSILLLSTLRQLAVNYSASLLVGFSGVVALLIHALVDGVLYHAPPTMLFSGGCVILALKLSHAVQKKESTKTFGTQGKTTC
jgi:O-antigen ligase